MMTPEELRAAMLRIDEKLEELRPAREALIRRLLVAVPEVATLHDAFFVDQGKELTYVFFESWLWPHTLLLLELRDNQGQLERIFGFVEALASSEDQSERDLAGIAILDHVFSNGVSGLAWPLMQKATRQKWLEHIMWQQEDTPGAYDEHRAAWMAEVERLGGPLKISVRDAYEIWTRTCSADRYGSAYRSEFRNWDIHDGLNEDEYILRFKASIGGQGDMKDWYGWLSRMNDIRQALLNDPELRRDVP